MSPEAASRIREFDPRAKIGLAVLMGILIWRTAPAGLLAYTLFFLLLVRTLRHSAPAGAGVPRTYFGFVLFWTLAKFGIDLLSGAAPPEALFSALVLGWRLIILLLLSLILAFSTSIRQLGLAVSWMLRPFLGRRSWQPALSLALMVHFLPLTWQTISDVRTVLAGRLPHYSAWRRMILLPGVTLRALGQKTWNQTLAVAGRGLDRPEAWETKIPSSPHALITAAGTALAAVLLALL